MEKLLTTKELAHAIGASESSLRRWTDGGAIRTSRTVGGHRRIALSEAIRFIRETGTTVVRPAVLGLPAETRTAGAGLAGADEVVYAALHDGDAERVHAEVTGLYLGGMSLAAIFDGPLGSAMRRVGELWHHGPSGILVEHRATDICLRVTSHLRQLLPPAPAGAPLALGGAPQGDPYMLPSMMVAAVLAEAGFRETNFGASTPVALLSTAAAEQGASVVWLSVSAADAAVHVRPDVEALTERLASGNATLLLGGRHAAEVFAGGPAPNVRLLHSMTELAAFKLGTAAAAAGRSPGASKNPKSG